MNLEEEIINYIDSHDMDDFTKIRWIYLYVSSKFSYDVRINLGSLVDKEEVYYKKVDIKNVEEYEIVCYTMANVLIDALSLYGFKGELVREKDQELTHVYVRVVLKDRVIKLDPMKRHDHTRIKMNSQTLDFSSLVDDPGFEEEVREADKKIHYPNLDKKKYPDYYNDTAIKNLAIILNNEARENNYSKEELFFKKLELIKILINKRDDFTRYDDIDYYMGYLVKNLGVNSLNQVYFKPIVFYKVNDDKSWDIINIILVDYPKFPPIFYVMRKKDKNYVMEEVSYQEVLEYIKEYNSMYSNYFLNILKNYKVR